MKEKINLDMPEVQPREQRLGTIIAWDGDIDELHRQSDFIGRAGCDRNAACKLCELRGPFSQGSVCSEQMVECQAGNVRDAVLIQHAPIGCGAGQVPYNSIYRNGLAMRGHKVENIRIINTNLSEDDVVFGAADKLRTAIDDAWTRYKPKAIFIATSCATGIIGEDVDSITREKQEDLVNVINLWGSDVFTPMLANLNLRVNYVIDLASVDDLARMSEAAATVGFCYTLSSYLAAALEEHFGVPEVKAPMPYGFAGTDAWLRELARITHREELAEKYIKAEHARVHPRIAELKKKLKGVKGYVATGSAYSHGLIQVLRELEVKVNGSLVFHHDPVYDSGDEREDSLGHLLKHYGNVENFHVSNRQQYQLYAFLQKVHPDFMLIRHNGLAPLASRLGIPAAPLGDEHIAIGYQGIINLGETILDILARKKYHDSIKKHVTLPYTDWWLKQEDAYILAR